MGILYLKCGSTRLTFQDDSNRNENSNELIRALVQLVRYTLHYYGCSSDTTNDKFYEEIQAANNAQLALETEAQTLDHIAAVKYPNLKPVRERPISTYAWMRGRGGQPKAYSVNKAM